MSDSINLPSLKCTNSLYVMRPKNVHDQNLLKSAQAFSDSCPDCTLHTAIIHTITVPKWWSLM